MNHYQYIVFKNDCGHKAQLQMDLNLQNRGILHLGQRVGGSLLEDQRLCALPIWLWLNGHEWAKRQLEKAGIGYEALDNGFRSCEDPEALQKATGWARVR